MASTLKVDSLLDTNGNPIDASQFDFSSAPLGKLKQIQKASTSGVTISTTTPTTVVGLTINVQGNNGVYMSFASDRNSDTGGAWNYFGFYVDGVQVSRNITSMNDASYQDALGHTWYVPNLTAGNHTIELKAWQGAGTSTWAEGGSGNYLVVMEIGA